MYLLMLLATFISAIYGYNLSPRADYERDYVRKKAMAMVYKFMYQEDAVRSLMNKQILSEAGLLQPDKIIYADTNNNKKLYYNGNNRSYSAADGFNLPLGRSFYANTEMVSRIICISKEGKQLHESGAGNCTSASGGGGSGVIGSCCDSDKANRYLVTYKKIDARFINRVYGGIGVDFYKAIVKRNYTDNIGVITWEDGKWHFSGKIYFEPVFAADKEAWDESHKDENGKITEFYPEILKQRIKWDMPSFFSEGYFRDKDSNDMCENGCLFKIRRF